MRRVKDECSAPEIGTGSLKHLPADWRDERTKSVDEAVQLSLRTANSSTPRPHKCALDWYVERKNDESAFQPLRLNSWLSYTRFDFDPCYHWALKRRRDGKERSAI